MDSLGDRMKRYEEVTQSLLTPRTPVILRIDGKAWHSWTKVNSCVRPFDETLMSWMAKTTEFLCSQISGSVFAYTQSDEISILIKDYQELETQAWFDGKVLKMVSVAASLATGKFNDLCRGSCSTAYFDARIFNVPKEDVVNYFIWRQNDAVRNSVQMLARFYFSHKEMQGKHNDEVKSMLLEHGVDWNKLEGNKKRGTSVYKEKKFIEEVVRNSWKIDKEIPRFSEEREFIGKWI